MKTIKLLSLFSLMLFFALNAKADDYHVRFAFMGNSITIGSGLSNAAVECYPSQLQLLLNDFYGDTCIVENFAVSGRTMLKHGDYPLWDEPQFAQSYNFAPDIVYIMLGTNDTKPYNWDDYGDEFIADYQSMIDTFKVRNPRCKFILAYPPPAFWVNYDIRDSVILNAVLPDLDSLIAANEAVSIDYYHPLLDSVDLFPDGIHPNAAGAKVMAKMLFDKIVESDIVHEVDPGYTYVTGITSSAPLIAEDSEVTISWSSRNADSVYFDGEKAELEGSKVFLVTENTTYTVQAFGQKNTDEMKFVQETYVQELNKIKADRSALKIEVGDSSVITIQFIDQYNKEILNQDFDITWEMTEGEGSLVNETSNSITLVGTVAGKVVLNATVGEYSVEARVNVVNKTGVDNIQNESFLVYPNPANDLLYFRTKTGKAVQYSLCNLSGKLLLSGETSKGVVDVSQVRKGFYILQINDGENRLKQKIQIQ